MDIRWTPNWQSIGFYGRNDGFITMRLCNILYVEGTSGIDIHLRLEIHELEGANDWKITNDLVLPSKNKLPYELLG